MAAARIEEVPTAGAYPHETLRACLSEKLLLCGFSFWQKRVGYLVVATFRRAKMNEREIIVPLELKAQYQMMLLAMCMLHLKFASGEPIGANCHSVARGIARHFPSFKVVDGFIPRLSGLESAGGDEVLIRFKTQPSHPVFAKITPMNHSWLAWKNDERFIVDVWPIGGVPGFAPPALVYQDQYSLVYTKGILTPGVTEESLQGSVDSFYARFKQACENLNDIHDSFKVGKAA